MEPCGSHFILKHFPEFYEHPPLAIYFQSLFFKLFGQGYGVERFYSFITHVTHMNLQFEKKALEFRP